MMMNVFLFFAYDYTAILLFVHFKTTSVELQLLSIDKIAAQRWQATIEQKNRE